VENFLKAIEVFGSIEALAVRYYETIAEMIEALRPHVVGHLDLIKKNLRSAGLTPDVLETPRIRQAIENTLDAAREYNVILDLNTAGWRKGLGEPYPTSALIRKAHERGIGFCFGDDSHRAEQIGAGIEEAREYLLNSGVPTVTVLTKEAGEVVRKVVAL